MKKYDKKAKKISGYSYRHPKTGKKVTVSPHKRHYYYRNSDYFNKRISRAKAKKAFEKRSERSKTMDRKGKAKKTYEEPVQAWLDDPSRSDVEGIDTPKKKEEDKTERKEDWKWASKMDDKYGGYLLFNDDGILMNPDETVAIIDKKDEKGNRIMEKITGDESKNKKINLQEMKDEKGETWFVDQKNEIFVKGIKDFVNQQKNTEIKEIGRGNVKIEGDKENLYTAAYNPEEGERFFEKEEYDKKYSQYSKKELQKKLNTYSKTKKEMVTQLIDPKFKVEEEEIDFKDVHIDLDKFEDEDEEFDEYEYYNND